MEPKFPKGLTHVKAFLQFSFYGEIKSEWTKENDLFHGTLLFPANTSALVRLPKDLNISVPTQKGIRKVTETDSHIEIELGSGTYHLRGNSN